MPCVQGFIRVDGDLAVDAAALRETLCAVLRSLLEPLAQVRDIVLLPSDRASGYWTASSVLAGGFKSSGGCYHYRIYVADRHDVEPLQETLLLEAESGGARSLLPLLMERLCDE